VFFGDTEVLNAVKPDQYRGRLIFFDGRLLGSSACVAGSSTIKQKHYRDASVNLVIVGKIGLCAKALSIPTFRTV
jgi:hypothetical protein